MIRIPDIWRLSLIAMLALFAGAASAQPFLVSDPVPAAGSSYTITHCVYVRGATTTLHPVETVTGGVRCKVDLASDPRTGTVSVAFRDNVLNQTGATTSFVFGLIPQPGNVRVVPN